VQAGSIGGGEWVGADNGGIAGPFGDGVFGAGAAGGAAGREQGVAGPGVRSVFPELAGGEGGAAAGLGVRIGADGGEWPVQVARVRPVRGAVARPAAPAARHGLPAPQPGLHWRELLSAMRELAPPPRHGGGAQGPARQPPAHDPGARAQPPLRLRHAHLPVAPGRALRRAAQVVRLRRHGRAPLRRQRLRQGLGPRAFQVRGSPQPRHQSLDQAPQPLLLEILRGSHDRRRSQHQALLRQRPRRVLQGRRRVRRRDRFLVRDAARAQARMDRALRRRRRPVLPARNPGREAEALQPPERRVGDTARRLTVAEPRSLRGHRRQDRRHRVPEERAQSDRRRTSQPTAHLRHPRRGRRTGLRASARHDAQAPTTLLHLLREFLTSPTLQQLISCSRRMLIDLIDQTMRCVDFVSRQKASLFRAICTLDIVN
jgi:hypothetical protein